MKLDALPHSVPFEILDLGLVVTLPEIDGTPLETSDGIVDPLQNTSYDAEYRGKQYALSVTSLKISNADAKIYFDSTNLNAGATPSDYGGGKGHGGKGKGQGGGKGKGKGKKHR